MWRGAKVAKSLNMEFEINVEGGFFWKKTSTLDSGINVGVRLLIFEKN